MDRVRFDDICRDRTGGLALDPLFDRLAARAPFGPEDIREAKRDEVLAALDLARAILPVTEAATASAVQAHNPACFLLVPTADLARAAMIALLPLNDVGAAALVDGRFDGMAPVLAHIARPGDAVAALYVWLVWTPGRMNSGLALIAEATRRYPGIAVFTRPVHAESARILERVGFRAANELFPAAPPYLVAALPGSAPAKSRITIRPAQGMDDLLKIFAVRTATYLSEQLCTYGEEFDANDFCATHLIGEIDGEPAGCLRIRWFADFAKLERLAIRPDHRRSRLMPLLVRAGFAHCRRKGYRRLYAHAREDLVPAWERFGARTVEGRPAFQFSDVTFREMVLDLEPAEDAIRFGADPLLTIRPEGAWDTLGPVELAQLRASDGRACGIEERVRRLRTG
jgi:predicted GNAT family N-acyltransferase